MGKKSNKKGNTAYIVEGKKCKAGHKVAGNKFIKHSGHRFWDGTEKTLDNCRVLKGVNKPDS